MPFTLATREDRQANLRQILFQGADQLIDMCLNLEDALRRSEQGYEAIAADVRGLADMVTDRVPDSTVEQVRLVRLAIARQN